MEDLDCSIYKQGQVHSSELNEFLKKSKTSIEKGLTREEVTLRRELYGLNKLSPPLQCPSWVCCLLPCILRIGKMKAFNETLPQEATIVRNGRKLRMDAMSVVRGDVVEVSAGDILPADVRFVEISGDLVIDASGLSTGRHLYNGTVECTDENHPQLSHNLAFMGTLVTTGSAKCVVIGTGDDTLWAQLIELGRWPMQHYSEDQKAPLMDKNLTV